MYVFGLFLSIFLVACGGGGGGGGGGDRSGGGNDPGSSLGRFTLDSNGIDVTVVQNSGFHSYDINLTREDGSRIEPYVKAASPGWLVVSVGPNRRYPASDTIHRVVTATIHPGLLTPGKHTNSFDVYTLDDRGNTLYSVKVPVNVTVISAVEFSQKAASEDFVYGAPAVTRTLTVPVIAADDNAWTISSNQPWLQVQDASGTGDKLIQARVDISGLMPGTYQGLLTLADADYAQNVSGCLVTVKVEQPQLVVEPAAILIGGADGRGDSVESAQVTVTALGAPLNFAYTLKFQSDTGANWLAISPATGTAQPAGQSIQLTADADSLADGRHTGMLQVEATVYQQKYTKEIPVTFNQASPRLVSSAIGVALSSAPVRKQLTRSVNIASSDGSREIPWIAVANQAWLTVTAAGQTGDDLIISANTSGLTPGRFYSGDVIVSSSANRVTNQETIRVGLAFLASEPVDVTVQIPENGAPGDTLLTSIVASPVEPLVFIARGARIQAYNIYSGALVRDFASLPPGSPRQINISGDGRSLFVYVIDYTAGARVVQLSAETGLVEGEYSVGSSQWAPNDLMPAYIRPAGIPYLVGLGNPYNLQTRQAVALVGSYVGPVSGSLMGSSNPEWVVPAWGDVYEYKYSVLDPDQLTIGRVFDADKYGAKGNQACISGDGLRLYSARGETYGGWHIYSFLLESGEVDLSWNIGFRPDMVACAWNGLVVGGVRTYYDNDDDIYLWDSKTATPLPGMRSSTHATYSELYENGLQISGDATRVIAISKDRTPGQLRLLAAPEL